ncbi:hypothetical protein QYH69_11470 [Paraburkholderia sp. SARCC-3016]|uniref:hypothetical protein n=1 Tax=Paraburkholderia sp. SARCC-3016 TaxID=3058611 RepID=UPI0028085D33|nr:hypothetical protein [Paraburkholderia sp. SARCC-3016]MDQ7977858.1 hypothetical protein [Paraburkholderia sp. SARCC-3016]
MVAPSVNILPASILRATLGRLSVVERIFVSSIGNPLGSARRAAYRKQRQGEFPLIAALRGKRDRISRDASFNAVTKKLFLNTNSAFLHFLIATV